MPLLVFLGSGDSQGVPRWWCNCNVCQEARVSGVNARTRPSVVLQAEAERVLIDASPELRLQMTREGFQSIDKILISHAHNDHILGLGDAADMGRWTGKSIPVFTPEEVIPQLKERFAYLTRANYEKRFPLNILEPEHKLFGSSEHSYTVSAHKVPHGFNGFSYGFRFDSSRGSWAYLSDSIGLTDLSPWQDLDLFVLGTSFYKEEAMYEKRSVYDVVEACDLVEQLKPKKVVFTHLGHGVDRRLPLQNARYAYDGLRLELP